MWISIPIEEYVAEGDECESHHGESKERLTECQTKTFQHPRTPLHSSSYLGDESCTNPYKDDEIEEDVEYDDLREKLIIQIVTDSDLRYGRFNLMLGPCGDAII